MDTEVLAPSCMLLNWVAGHLAIHGFENTSFVAGNKMRQGLITHVTLRFRVAVNNKHE